MSYHLRPSRCTALTGGGDSIRPPAKKLKMKFRDFQKIIADIYGQPDDRHFSIYDLVSNQNRFTMRALKGIRKKDSRKIKANLIIAFCWLLAIANRLHIDLDDAIWRRFPNLCSYCGKAPCQCKKIKPRKRRKIGRIGTARPTTIAEFQAMFGRIYPPGSRSVVDAGIHLAEETGEIGEAITIYLGEHRRSQFTEIENELADWISTMFGLVNSINFDLERDVERSFKNGCHICKSTPCKCSFSYIAKFDS